MILFLGLGRGVAIPCNQKDGEGECGELADDGDYGAHGEVQGEGPIADFGELQNAERRDVVADTARSRREDNSHPITMRAKAEVRAKEDGPCQCEIHDARSFLEEREGKGDQNGEEKEGGFKRHTECRQPYVEEMVGVETHAAGAFDGRVHLPAEPIQTGEDEFDAEEPDASQQNDG